MLNCLMRNKYVLDLERLGNMLKTFAGNWAGSSLFCILAIDCGTFCKNVKEFSILTCAVHADANLCATL